MSTSNLCQDSAHVVHIGTSFKENPLNIADIDRPLSDLTTQFLTGSIIDANYNDPVTTAVREYGEDTFYKSVADINTYFARTDLRALVTEADTPLLNQRVTSDYVFTPVEIAQYIRDFGYTPISLSNQTQVVSNKIPKELEAFYAKNFTSSSMGSFCSLLPTIFGAIGVFFSALNDVANLVNKLKNFALNFSLAGLINQLKTNILNVIDKTIEKVKSIIDNFSMENILSTTNRVVNDVICKEFMKIKETVQRFFDGTAIENFKKKIEALIDYAVGLFKDPTLDEIQYLMYRFCGFISSVEEGINALKEPLNNYANVYKQTAAALAARSAWNTAFAKRAGAIRYTDEERKEGINNGIERAKSQNNQWQEPVSCSEYENITTWNNGEGDGRITFFPSASMKTSESWAGLDISTRVKLMRVQKEFGKQLIILKGYRPLPSDFASVVKSFSTVGTEMHAAGKAVDLQWDDYNITNREEFITIARHNGFGGIGRYKSYLHIDLGPNREWIGPNLSSDDPNYNSSYNL